MSLFNIPVSLLGGRLCFSCMDSLCLSFLKKKNSCRISMKATVFQRTKQPSYTLFFLSLSFSFSHPLTQMCTRTHEHIHRQMYMFRHTKKKATLFLSALMSLGTIKSLPQILLRVEEQGDGMWSVMIADRVVLCTFVCAHVCVHICVCQGYSSCSFTNQYLQIYYSNHVLD